MVVGFDSDTDCVTSAWMSRSLLAGRLLRSTSKRRNRTKAIEAEPIALTVAVAGNGPFSATSRIRHPACPRSQVARYGTPRIRFLAARLRSCRRLDLVASSRRLARAEQTSAVPPRRPLGIVNGNGSPAAWRTPGSAAGTVGTFLHRTLGL